MLNAKNNREIHWFSLNVVRLIVIEDYERYFGYDYRHNVSFDDQWVHRRISNYMEHAYGKTAGLIQTTRYEAWRLYSAFCVLIVESVDLGREQINPTLYQYYKDTVLEQPGYWWPDYDQPSTEWPVVDVYGGLDPDVPDTRPVGPLPVFPADEDLWWYPKPEPEPEDEYGYTYDHRYAYGDDLDF